MAKAQEKATKKPKKLKKPTVNKKPKAIKKMCMKKQGRWGSHARKPSRSYLKKLVPKKLVPKSTLALPLQEWAITIKSTLPLQESLDFGRVRFASLDDKKIKSIKTITAAVKLGVPRAVAPRVVAKIAGLVAHTK